MKDLENVSGGCGKKPEVVAMAMCESCGHVEHAYTGGYAVGGFPWHCSKCNQETVHFYEKQDGKLVKKY